MEFILIICKICNFEVVKIEIKCKDGLIVNIDLLGKCDMSDEFGVDMLWDVLMELIDMFVFVGSVNFEYVDVGFFILFLKVIICWKYNIVEKCILF